MAPHEEGQEVSVPEFSGVQIERFKAEKTLMDNLWNRFLAQTFFKDDDD